MGVRAGGWNVGDGSGGGKPLGIKTVIFFVLVAVSVGVGGAGKYGLSGVERYGGITLC